MSKNKNEISVPPAANKALANTGDTRGFEQGVDNDDLIIPRVKLLQPLSPELREFPTLRPGQIINSLTKEELPAAFVPIFYFKEYMRFNARSKDKPGFDASIKPGALMWRTRDAADKRVVEQCAFGPNSEPPLALSMLNFFCLFEGSGMPVILSFSKTSYKAGKNLLSLAKLRGGAMFSRRYKLTTREDTNDSGTFHVLVVNPNGDCDAATLAAAGAAFDQYGPKREAIKAHVEDETPF